MLSKLHALIPLFGWFYITIFVFTFFWYILRGKARKLLTILFFTGFGIYAAVLSFQSLKDEYSLLKISKESVSLPYQKKIERQAGNSYELYYEKVSPYLNGVDVVFLVNQFDKDYFYARMYLYPASVQQVTGVDPNRKGVYILSDGLKKQFSRSMIKADMMGKILVDTRREK